MRYFYFCFFFFVWATNGQAVNCNSIDSIESRAIRSDLKEDPFKSLAVTKQLYKLFLKCDTERSQRFEHKLALAYLKAGIKDSAIYHSERALRFSDSKNNDALRIPILTTLGMLYNQEGAYSAALRNYYEVYKFYHENTSSPSKKAISAINLTQTFLKLKQRDSASVYLNEALNQGAQTSNHSLRSYIFGIRFEFLKDENEQDAKNSLQQSIDEALKAKDYSKAIEATSLLVHYDSVIPVKKKKEHIELIEEHIQSVTNTALLKNLYVQLFDYYLKQKNWSKIDEYNNLKDSVFKILYQNRNLKEIASLDSLNNSIKAKNLELENNLLKKEKHSQTLLIALLVTILLSFLTNTLMQRSNRKSRIRAQGSKEEEISQLLSLNEKPNTTKKQIATFKKTLELIKKEKVFKNPNLKLNDLAQTLSVSPRHLSNSINNCYSNNFNALLNRYRVEEAKKILIEMHKRENHLYSLEYVWEQCGFSNEVNFFRTFKKVTGLTPTEFVKSKSL